MSSFLISYKFTLQVMMVLMISGCAAATGIGYIGRFGEEKIGWGAVCGRVGEFCNRMLVSVAFSYSAFLSYLALTIISASKLMSQATEWNHQKRTKTQKTRKLRMIWLKRPSRGFGNICREGTLFFVFFKTENKDNVKVVCFCSFCLC